MNSEKKLSTHLKKAFHALTILVCFGGLTSLCLGNDGTKLTINGGDPIPGPGSVLCWASVDQGEIVSCTWSADPSNGIATTEPQGNHQCMVTFTASGSISLTCDATIMLNGNQKRASDSKTIRCEAPTTNAPTLKIDGPGEVSINSMHEYTAKYSGYEGNPRISWQYHGGTDNGERTTIHFLTNMTHHLECTLYYNEGNTEKSLFAEMYIKVLPEVSLTAMRADYKNYTNAVISGTEVVKIHYNVDDDDFSYVEDPDEIGADCDQKTFIMGKDNDLCKVELSFGEGIKAEEITDGTLFFEVPKGLRLWPSPKRRAIFIENLREDEEPLEKSFSFSNIMDRNKILPMLTNGFYVEGVLSGPHNLKISFAAVELNLPYFCYSVGGKDDQPKGTKRESLKQTFRKLVDCEWCVKELENTNYFEIYNCIAYAVDPKRQVFNGTNNYVRPFEGAFKVLPNDRDPEAVSGFDTWPNATNRWREDPFMYKVSFKKQDFNNKLESKFREKFNDTSITPYSNSVENTYYRMGYSSEFKKLLNDVLKEQPKLMRLKKRFTTMAVFNRPPSGKDDIDNFFTMSDFAASSDNPHPLVGCEINDNDRIIIYYSNYHAARALSKTDYYNDLVSNLDPDWDIAVSKCGEEEVLLIHREEQVSSYYDNVERAYK